MRKQIGSILLLTFTMLLTRAFAQSNAFTYQGRLDDNGARANGAYDLRFTLYDAATNGNAITLSQTNSAVIVSNGLFTTSLDFGNVFVGANYWLEIAARINGGSDFNTLAPRQLVTPAPFAVTAGSANNLIGSFPVAKITGSLSATQLNGTLSQQQLPGVVVTNNQTNLSLAGSFAGSGVNLTNIGGTIRWQVIAGTSQQAQRNMGYVVTNDSLVTITLPPNNAINLGDIVRVSGGGLNGWKIAQNNGQFVRAVTSIANTTSGTSGYLTGGSESAIELQYVGSGQFLPLSYAGTVTAF